MNQDELKNILLKYNPGSEIAVIYSGKRSTKIDGLYRPDTKEVVINNKNFKDDSSLVYTGLHELAHHIDAEKNGPRPKPHAGEFPEILTGLVNQAIEGGDFEPMKHEVIDRARRANRAYAEAMKQLGKALIDCLELCSTRDYPFEDIVSRELSMTNAEAKAIIKVHTMDISPQVGGELAKKLTKISNLEERHKAEKDKIIKKAKPPKKKEQDEFTRLSLEKKKLEKSLNKLHNKLDEINLQLDGYEHPDPPQPRSLGSPPDGGSRNRGKSKKERPTV